MTRDVFDGEISATALARWFSQFPQEHVGFVQTLLDHFRYYSVGRVRQAQAITHQELVLALGASIQSAIYVPIGYLTRGGASAVYLYCSEHRIGLDRVVTRAALSTLDLSTVSAVVFLDDYIGTGRQVQLLWDSLASERPELTTSVPLYVEATVATRGALTSLSTTTGFRVLVAEVLDEHCNAFASNSAVFANPAERAEAMQVLRRYGERLNPVAPLGYAAPQNLLGFFYSTLSNTLPIFWSSVNGWIPLLPHKQSIAGSAGHEAVTAPRYTIPGPSSDPEIVKSLIQEYRQTDAVLCLLPILSKLHFSRDLVAHLIEYVRRVKHLNHEARPVRVSMLFGPEGLGTPHRSLRYRTAPAPQVESFDRVTALAQLVDGFEGGVAVTLTGSVDSVFAFDQTGDHVPFVPSRWQAPARASAALKGLLLTSDGSGRMSVFHAGRRVLTHRGATWHVQPSTLLEDARSLAASHALPDTLVARVLELAIELSDRGDGAMITVGSAGAVLQLADPIPDGKFEMQPTALEDTPPCLLVGPLRQDGASVVDQGGILVSGMRFLRPSAEVIVTAEADWGARHTTAAKVSAATGCLVVVVSTDGAITVLSRGRVSMKLMG